MHWGEVYAAHDLFAYDISRSFWPIIRIYTFTSYLKNNGVFIFSWHHTLNYCIAWSCDKRQDVLEDDKLVMTKSYFDESYFRMPVHGSEIILCNRKISTYINALAKAGFVIEQFVEESNTDSEEVADTTDIKTRKARMLPISFCIKARKL